MKNRIAMIPLDLEAIRVLMSLLAPDGGWSDDPVKARTQAALSIGLQMLAEAPPRG